MKNYLKFFFALLAIPFIVVACTKSEVDTPDPETLEPFTISVEGTTVEDVTAKVTYSASTQYPYIVGVIEQTILESSLSSSDPLIVEYLIETLEAKDVDVTVADNAYVYSGSASVLLADFWSLTVAKQYYVVAFAVDSDGDLLTDVVKYLTEPLAEVAEPEATDIPTATFVEATYKSITVDVAMNDYVGNYFTVALSKTNYDKYYGSNAETAANALLAEEIEAGTDFSEVDGAYICNTDAQINLGDWWWIYGESEYIVLTFGVTEDGALNSGIGVLEATSGDFIVEDITVSVDEVSMSDIVVSATAPSSEDIFVVWLMEKYLFESEYDSNAKALSYPIITTLLYNYIDPLECLSPYSFLGSASSVSLNDGYTVNYNTEYVILTFAIDENYALTSDVTITEATTDDFVNTGANLESLTIDNISYFNCEASVKVGEYTGNYYLTIFLEDELQDNFDGDIDQMVEWMIEYELDYGTDFSTPNDRWVFTGDLDHFLMGDGGWNILSGENYYAFAFGVSPTGEVVTDILQSELISTPAINNLSFELYPYNVTDNSAVVQVTPSIDNVTYFSQVFASSDIEGLSDDEILYKISIEYSTQLLMGLTTGTTTTTYSELNAGSDYTAIAFGYYPSSGMIGSVVKESFTTTGGGSDDNGGVPSTIVIPDVEFGSITFDEFASWCFYVNITPLDEDMNWLYSYMTKEEYDALGSPEAVIKYHLEKLEASCWSGTSLSDYLYYQCYDGEWRRSCGTADTGEFVAFAYGIDLDNIQPLTKLATVNVVRTEADYAPVAAPQVQTTTYTREGKATNAVAPAKSVKAAPAKSINNGFELTFPSNKR